MLALQRDRSPGTGQNDQLRENPPAKSLRFGISGKQAFDVRDRMPYQILVDLSAYQFGRRRARVLSDLAKRARRSDKD